MRFLLSRRRCCCCSLCLYENVTSKYSYIKKTAKRSSNTSRYRRSGGIFGLSAIKPCAASSQNRHMLVNDYLRRQAIESIHSLGSLAEADIVDVTRSEWNGKKLYKSRVKDILHYYCMLLNSLSFYLQARTLRVTKSFVKANALKITIKLNCVVSSLWHSEGKAVECREILFSLRDYSIIIANYLPESSISPRFQFSTNKA